MARPRIDANARRSRQFGVRLTPAEARLVEAAAARAGRPAVAFIRAAALAAAGRGEPARRAGPDRADGHPTGTSAYRRQPEPGASARSCRPRYQPRRRGQRRARRRRTEAGVIPRIHAGGRGVRGLVAYITHDASSPGERHPTTDERVGLVAGLNLPTDDPHLAGLIMARTAADAEVIKQLAGTSSRGRKLKAPFSHLSLSWSPNEPRPDRAEMRRATEEALKSIGMHACQAPRRRAHRHRAPARTRGGLSRGPGDREGLRAPRTTAGNSRPGRRSTSAAAGGVQVPNRIARREAREQYRTIVGVQVDASVPGRRGEAEGARRGSAAPDGEEARRAAGRPGQRRSGRSGRRSSRRRPSPRRRRTRRGASGCGWPARIGGGAGGRRSSRRSRN